MPPIPLFQVDAFTSKPFAGNPAAVCLLEKEADSDWMQMVAAEMNLSETAFVQRIDKGFALRWFTPATEVDLCGHATLATAHILWQEGWLKSEQMLHFHTRSGLLTAKRVNEQIELDFPATPGTAATAPNGLFRALGITDGNVHFNGVDYLIEIGDESELRELKPDFAALKEIPIRGIVVTTASQQPHYDFVSRFFAPAVGVDEDPVTGSAHCTLAPFWADCLDKTHMRAFQASSRGGEIEIELLSSRVLLRGHARTVFEGHLLA